MASVFHQYSLGEVTNNPDYDDHVIWVMPTEKRYGITEETLNNPQREEFTYKDHEGNERSGNSTSNTGIQCTWMRRNSNRVTPPNVRRGDEVTIWRLGDSNKYFWEDNCNTSVKRVERVIFAYAADPSGPLKGDLSNCYIVEISPVDGLYGIHTSTANGEPFEWDFQIDAKGGRAAIESSNGEHVLIDSNERLIELANSDGSVAKLDKRNGVFDVPDDMTFNAGKTEEYNCKRFIVNASVETIFNTPKFRTSDDLEVGGKATLEKDLKVNEGISGGGGAEFTKPVKAPSFDGPCNKAH